MDYITININKTFLRRAALIIGVCVITVGSYKFGYSKGSKETIAAIMEYLSGGARQDGPASRSDEKTHEGSSIQF